MASNACAHLFTLTTKASEAAYCDMIKSALEGLQDEFVHCDILLFPFCTINTWPREFRISAAFSLKFGPTCCHKAKS